MEIQYTFKRYEKKYLLTRQQYEQLHTILRRYMDLDEYGRYTICNVYFDTDDYALIRSSIEKPAYKEKFRMRSYGVTAQDKPIFAEIKKKFKGVVYKRRIDALWRDAVLFVSERGEGFDSISEDIYSVAELREFVRRYTIKPKVFLAYEREALVGRSDPTLRLTFDQNIRWRDYDLNLYTSDEGKPVQEGDDHVVMEIKVPYSIPLWLTKILSENQLYPGSFSKYGTCYKNYICKTLIK